MNHFVKTHPFMQFIPLKTGSKLPNGALVPRGHLDGLTPIEFPPHWENAENFGIVLDNQYLVVDADTDHPEMRAFLLRLPATRQHYTKRGAHYLFTTPPGFEGKNKSLRATDGTHIGDVKIKGYIVAPGSVVDGYRYTAQEGLLIKEAPSWLLDVVRATPADTGPGGPSFDLLPSGNRDNSLHRIGSNLRSIGYNQQAIASILQDVADKHMEQPEGNEIGRPEIQRIARSVSRYETEGRADTGALIPRTVLRGTDVEFVGPPTIWWLRGFIPKGELVTMFGKGGIGKSTFASWLCSLVTRNGGTFGVVSTEEPFSRFVARAVLSGADRSKIFCIPHASSILFPRDGNKLRELLETLPLDVVFFDSIYTHFEAIPGLNAAERTRTALSTLSEITLALGTTMIGNFHENKLGNYLGSVEMENVARVMLKLSRKKGKHLRVHVEKTFKAQPDYDLEFPGEEVVIADPDSGEIQLEANDQGELVPETIIIARDPIKREFESLEEEHVNISELEDSGYRDDTIRDYKEKHPEASLREMEEVFGVSRMTIKRTLDN